MTFSFEKKDIKKITIEWVKSALKPLIIIASIIFALIVYFIVVYFITKDKEALGYMVDMIIFWLIITIVMTIFIARTNNRNKKLFLSKSENGSLNYNFELKDDNYMLTLVNTGSLLVFKKSDISSVRYTKNFIFLSFVSGGRTILRNCEEIKNILK